MPEDRTSEVTLSIPSLILSCDTGISPTVTLLPVSNWPSPAHPSFTWAAGNVTLREMFRGILRSITHGTFK